MTAPEIHVRSVLQRPRPFKSGNKIQIVIIDIENKHAA